MKIVQLVNVSWCTRKLFLSLSVCLCPVNQQTYPYNIYAFKACLFISFEQEEFITSRWFW